MLVYMDSSPLLVGSVVVVQELSLAVTGKSLLIPNLSPFSTGLTSWQNHWGPWTNVDISVRIVLVYEYILQLRAVAKRSFSRSIALERYQATQETQDWGDVE